MKKLLTIVIVVILCIGCLFSFTACQTADYTIGICQLVQHEALDAATKGFMDAIEEGMAKQGKTVKFDLQNASNDASMCSTIINSFVSTNVDLIMANATPALQAAAQATKKNQIPVLGTSVTEYGVALGIENFNGVVGSNVSGTSDLAPLDQQAQMILDLLPQTKTVGILFCSKEPNSKYQAKVVKEYLEAKNITVTEYPFNDGNDVNVFTETACQNDVVYIPTDNTAAKYSDIIGTICTREETPVIAGEEGICKGCGVATLTIDYYELGRKTGEMALQILLEGKDIAQMEVGYHANPVYKYNKELCSKYGVIVPENYQELAK